MPRLPAPVEQVRGPISLSEHWHPGLGKHIYVFGDKHVNQAKCRESNQRAVRIDQFLDRVIKANKDKVLDIFLEMEYIGSRSGKRQRRHHTFEEPRDFITGLMVTYEQCLRISKRACEHPNIRAHYVDIRFHRTLESIIMEWFVMGQGQPEATRSSRDHSRAVHEWWLHGLQHSPVLVNSFPLQQPLINRILEETKIKKQLAAVKDAKLRQYLLNWGLNELHRLNRAFGSDITTLRTAPQKTRAFFAILEIVSTFMDMYALARIFRSFRQVPGKYSDDPTHVIIYAGDAHSQNYRRVLKKLGFKLVQETRSEKRYHQCLDISRFHQPFFHNEA
jgi:hypothetical protein